MREVSSVGVRVLGEGVNWCVRGPDRGAVVRPGWRVGQRADRQESLTSWRCRQARVFHTAGNSRGH